jgi:dihydrofolate synthase/folylpolyglutamate synthase
VNYAEFTDWMFGLERFGIKLGLENVTEFLDRIGNPHRDFKTIHVTGTNGKGSMCVFVSEILRQHGMKVGLYTSPHLVDFRERIKIDGEEIGEEDVLRLGVPLKRIMELMESEDREKQLTFFEFTTGLAFKYFAEKKADIVVTEVGMGGRLDATNVVTPEVAAITRIGLEHTNYLGKTIQDIAREKAGIIKPGSRVVTCERGLEALTVIETTCRKKRASLRTIGKDFNVSHVHQTLHGTEFDYRGRRNLRELKTRLLGGYQAENAAGAIAVIEELPGNGISVTDGEIRDGLLSARWPGRLDIASENPLVILDGSHNPDGVSTTVKVLTDLKITPLTYVVGCMDDKDAVGIVRAIAPTASMIICTQSRYKRALSADKLDLIVSEEFKGPHHTVVRSEEAFERAIKTYVGKGICVIGSLYVVGEAIPWWQTSGKHLALAHKV